MSELFTITVGHYNADLTGNSNEVIQAAVDRAAAVGRGIVRILPGVYTMNNSLHLRSGVTVMGSGDDTILWKPPSVSSSIDLYLGYGHFDVSVAEPEKFRIGMGIKISDNNSGGFYNTVATIIGKNGNDLIIDRMLNHDYHPADNAKVVTVYPIVSGCDIEDASVCDLLVDGNAAENEYIDGCRGGGVYLLRNKSVIVRNITVRNYNGDAISFQQCIDTLIENCRCIDNTGSGLHPGSGSVGAIMRNIVCRRNGSDGIFYCLRVSHSLCEGCIFENNGRDGISIGHRDNENIIRNNVILDNRRHGIYFRKDDLGNSGQNTIISGNKIHHNGKVENTYQVYMDCSVKNLHFFGNEFIPANKSGALVYLNANPEGVWFYDNIGLGSDPDNIAPKEREFLTGISFTQPDLKPKAGPEHVTDGSYYHLHRHNQRSRLSETN